MTTPTDILFRPTAVVVFVTCQMCAPQLLSLLATIVYNTKTILDVLFHMLKRGFIASTESTLVKGFSYAFNLAYIFPPISSFSVSHAIGLASCHREGGGLFTAARVFHGFC